jgi:hypothetical protein
MKDRSIAGSERLKNGAMRNIKVTLDVVDLKDGNGKIIVTLKVDGNFDKTGLPDPFLMDFHFKVDANRIIALDIRLPDEKPGD